MDPEKIRKLSLDQFAVPSSDGIVGWEGLGRFELGFVKGPLDMSAIEASDVAGLRAL